MQDKTFPFTNRSEFIFYYMKTLTSARFYFTCIWITNCLTLTLVFPPISRLYNKTSFDQYKGTANKCLTILIALLYGCKNIDYWENQEEMHTFWAALQFVLRIKLKMVHQLQSLQCMVGPHHMSLLEPGSWRQKCLWTHSWICSSIQ